jgi:hypothetical protein
MPDDIELTDEFLDQIPEFGERPETVVEKLQLSPVELLRFKGAHELSPDENEAYKALLAAAIQRARHDVQSHRDATTPGFLADVAKSVGAITMVVIGALSHSGDIFLRRRRTKGEVWKAMHESGSKKSPKNLEGREQHQRFAHEEE